MFMLQPERISNIIEMLDLLKAEYGMANGKIRNSNHITDSRATRFLRGAFPCEWVPREMSPDYGIDFDLELFGYEEGNCTTLGEHVFLQVKGTDNAQYGRIKLFGKNSGVIPETDIDVLKFSIEVSLLNLVERMGSGVPVLLIVVDLQEEQAYYMCLNDYIRYVLHVQNPDYKKQDSVTIYIPVENTISDQVFMWYGKRAKMYALFQEIHAVADDCMYTEGADLVLKVQALLERIREHDAWKARTFWGYMAVQHMMLAEMCENDMITKESIAFVQLASEDPDNWRESVVYVAPDERPTRGYVFAQESCCRHFLECASGMASDFEGRMRHLGLPTITSSMLM